jgi:hypothetical protein
MGVRDEWDLAGFRPCPRCHAKCKKSAAVCPRCRGEIIPVDPTDRCAGCKEPIQPHWKVCPACDSAIDTHGTNLLFDGDGLDI